MIVCVVSAFKYTLQWMTTIALPPQKHTHTHTHTHTPTPCRAADGGWQLFTHFLFFIFPSCTEQCECSASISQPASSLPTRRNPGLLAQAYATLCNVCPRLCQPMEARLLEQWRKSRSRDRKCVGAEVHYCLPIFSIFHNTERTVLSSVLLRLQLSSLLLLLLLYHVEIEDGIFIPSVSLIWVMKRHVHTCRSRVPKVPFPSKS